ncbi:MAG: ParB/Srx family N-terminal domain-containing protein [Bacteroidota bacterium]
MSNENSKSDLQKQENNLKRQLHLLIRKGDGDSDEFWEMHVIDGQHRIAACKMLGETVYYIKDDITKEDIAILNTAQKNWTRMDFINFYAIEGRGDFETLAALINTYPRLKVSFLLNTCGRSPNLRAGEINLTKIRNVKLQLTNRNQRRPMPVNQSDSELSEAEFIKKYSTRILSVEYLKARYRWTKDPTPANWELAVQEWKKTDAAKVPT